MGFGRRDLAEEVYDFLEMDFADCSWLFPAATDFRQVRYDYD